MLFLLILIFNFSHYSQSNENLEFFINRIQEVKKKKCYFLKKGLEFKKYNLEYTIINGYWKNDNVPYGEWIEKTYSNKIIKTQCYQKNIIFFKNYADNRVVTVTYIDENIRIDGDFGKENELTNIIVFSHNKGKFSLKRIFFLRDEIWQEKDLTYPSILDLDLDMYLYLIDKEKFKI